jgi:predicted CopG family antitoxin
MMATKTIRLDVEAYEQLKSAQKATESFSQTIKRVVRKPVDLRAWFAAMDRSPLSRQAADAIARHVKARSRQSRGRLRPE